MSDEPGLAEPFIVTPGAGRHVDMADMQMRLKASAGTTAGALTFWETIDEPGFGPPPHIHHDTSEAFYVLEGEYLIWLDGQETACGPGSFIFIPKGARHGFRVGNLRSRKLMLFVPGAMEGYFHGMAQALTSGDVSDELQAEIASRNNMEVLPKG
jgi:mannose-6-phosphate isomerase-like protein (cupin superfamily)